MNRFWKKDIKIVFTSSQSSHSSFVTVAGGEGSTGNGSHQGSGGANENSSNHGAGDGDDDPPDDKHTKIPAQWYVFLVSA